MLKNEQHLSEKQTISFSDKYYNKIIQSHLSAQLKTHQERKSNKIVWLQKIIYLIKNSIL